MLTYISASTSGTVVEPTEVIPMCLPMNVTDGKWVFHLNAALARCSHAPYGDGYASLRA
jgi:hypothetical protein